MSLRSRVSKNIFKYFLVETYIYEYTLWEIGYLIERKIYLFNFSNNANNIFLYHESLLECRKTCLLWSSSTALHN